MKTYTTVCHQSQKKLRSDDGDGSATHLGEMGITTQKKKEKRKARINMGDGLWKQKKPTGMELLEDGKECSYGSHKMAVMWPYAAKISNYHILHNKRMVCLNKIGPWKNVKEFVLINIHQHSFLFNMVTV